MIVGTLNIDKHICGKRIKLLDMPLDPDPIPVGTCGTVFGFSEFQGRIHLSVNWEINRGLSLVCPPDKFEIID